MFEKIQNKFYQYAPSFIVCANFLPSGLLFGYTICTYLAERKSGQTLMEYGPLVFGACWGFVAALILLAVKYFFKRVVYWHLHVLFFAGIFNLIASGFFFADGLAHVGAFVSFVAHALAFLAGFTFIQTTASKCSRAVLLSACCSFYLLGVATAVKLIGITYKDNDNNNNNTNENESTLSADFLADFALTYVCLSAILVLVLICLIVANYLGKLDTESSIEEEFRDTNAEGVLFDKREDMIGRVQFFYVTKNQQWHITLLLLLADAVQYAIFIYFVFWFTLNNTVSVVDAADSHVIYWAIFAGSVLGTLSLIFVSVKTNFVATQLALILVAVISMIICSTVESTAPYWIILVFLGMAYSSLQIAIVEMANLRYTELAIYVSYLLKLLCTSVVSYYCVSNLNNYNFYSTDNYVLLSHGFVFIIISALLALVVGMKVPRTHRTPILDVQYTVNGIVFKRSQIEQLNPEAIEEAE